MRDQQLYSAQQLRSLLQSVWEEEKSVAARYAQAAQIVLNALPESKESKR
ncbi:MAG: hypothetical protein ACRD2H_13160 [Terriglobales bacterium]